MRHCVDRVDWTVRQLLGVHGGLGVVAESMWGVRCRQSPGRTVPRGRYPIGMDTPLWRRGCVGPLKSALGTCAGVVLAFAPPVPVPSVSCRPLDGPPA